MYIRPLYLGCFSYRRDLANGNPPSESEWWFGHGLSTSAQLQPLSEPPAADSFLPFFGG